MLPGSPPPARVGVGAWDDNMRVRVCLSGFGIVCVCVCVRAARESPSEKVTSQKGCAKDYLAVSFLGAL